MKIKHTKHCLEMNKILKNIPCKIYYAGIFLVVMMFLVLFFINHFIQYERTIYIFRSIPVHFPAAYKA